MKKTILLLILISAVSVFGYIITNQKEEIALESEIGSCISIDGKVETMKNDDGTETKICVFKDGSKCNLWELYIKQCFPSQKFNDKDIKKFSQSQVYAIAQTWILDNKEDLKLKAEELKYGRIEKGQCANCYVLYFFFDRPEEPKPHEHQIVVTIQDQKIISAILDRSYDQVTKTQVSSN